jgi:hypothetical protein
MPSTPFTSTMGRMGQYQPQFLLHEKLTGGFFVFLFHVFMFCDKKYDLKSDSLSNLTILFQSTL